MSITWKEFNLIVENFENSQKRGLGRLFGRSSSELLKALKSMKPISEATELSQPLSPEEEIELIRKINPFVQSPKITDSQKKVLEILMQSLIEEEANFEENKENLRRILDLITKLENLHDADYAYILRNIHKRNISPKFNSGLLSSPEGSAKILLLLDAITYNDKAQWLRSFACNNAEKILEVMESSGDVIEGRLKLTCYLHVAERIKDIDFMYFLNNLQLFNATTRDLIKNHTDIRKFESVVKMFESYLKRIPMKLTQDHIEIAAKYTKIFDQCRTNIDRLPPLLQTEVLFNRMVELCREPEQPNEREETRNERIITAIKRELQMALDRLNPNVEKASPSINYAQSTHNETVHKSVSESILRLKQRYGKQISSSNKLNKVLNEIKEWASHFDPVGPSNLEQKPLPTPIQIEKVFLQDKKAAAYRAIFSGHTRVLDDINYVDSGSEVSIKEMYALYWIAAHDLQTINERLPAEHHLTIEQAEERYVEGLYQRQREYGFLNNPEGSDFFYEKGGRDNPSCAGGSFNKMTEVFASVHPDAQIKIQSKELASMVIQQMVREKVVAHLEATKDTEAFKEILEQLEKDGPSVLGENAKMQIRKAFIAEFTTLSKNDINAMIDSIDYVDCSECLAKFKMESPSPK